MCGIAGLWQPSGLDSDAGELVRRMTDTLRHRGPDDAGLWTDASAGIALGHRRLSIIDLSPEGHQPMHSADGRYTTVFNGEIYNYPALREKLAAAGARFRGTSDTEVLIELIAREGVEAALRQCVGMFALAVWDARARELYLARDRMGEKPLYYASTAAGVAFASELPALELHPMARGSINREIIPLYLQLGYVPAPYSIVAGVQKLPPATIAHFRAGAAPVLTRYWELPAPEDGQDQRPLPDDEYAARLVEQLRVTVRGQMLADVPLGALLSGGVDSSLIVSLMQEASERPVRTFTIGFEEARYDEAGHARRVAQHLGTQHTELYLPGDEAMGLIPRIPSVFGEPFADASALPTMLVAELARTQVTVALSGDGGDELFLGYNWHARANAMWSRLRHCPPPLRRAMAAGVEQAGGLFAAGTGSLRWRDRSWRLADLLRAPSVAGVHEVLGRQVARGGAHGVDVARTERARLAGLGRRSVLRSLSLADIDRYLSDDILVKSDRSAMAFSLETRAPLLDHRVVELAWQMPDHVKIRGGTRKWILRQLLDQRLPREITERPKQGFSVPIGDWLRGPMKAWASDLLSPDRLARHALVPVAETSARWREHLAGTQDWQYALWPVLMLEAWLDTRKSS